MKKSNWLLLTTILVITSAMFFFTFSYKMDVDSMGDDIAAIEQLWDNYALANNTGDLELYMSLMADDIVKMPPNKPAFSGKELLREKKEKGYANYTVEMAIYNEEVQVDGDLAFSRGTYTVSQTPKAGGETVYVDGKYLTILKRQPDGSWKIYRDCYNSNAPPK